MQLKNIIEDVKATVLEAGSFIEQEQKKFDKSLVKEKSTNQLVSYVDIEVEKRLVKDLSSILPDAGFIGEEETTENSNSKDYTWIIDPLDGTTNFIHSLPVYSISIGLTYKNKEILGVIYEPNRKELFSAFEHNGAFLNNKKIEVSKSKNFNETLLATGFPYYDFDKVEAYLNVLDYLMKHTRGLRRMGSAAVDLAYTACGRFDGFFEYGLSPWDVAGGSCIVKEAGGIVCDFKGEDNYIFGKEIIACNPNLANQFIDLIKSNFYKNL